MSGVPRLSGSERRILKLLIAHGEMYGLAMVHESHGELKRGGIYVTLSRMEKKGLVDSRVAEGTHVGPPRKLYRPSGLGELAFRAAMAAEQVWSRGLVPEGGR